MQSRTSRGEISGKTVGFTYNSQELGPISITFKSISERNYFYNNLTNVSFE